MPKQWGRLYSGTRHHPQIRRLRQECPDSWWIWYPLLEMAIEMDNNGYVDHAELEPMSMKQLAGEVGLREKKFTETVLIMEKLKLITFFAKHLIVSSYNERQFKSDNISERVAKYRESLKRESLQKRYMKQHCNTPETETDIKENIIKEKVEKPKKQKKPMAVSLPDDFIVSEAVKTWANKKGFDRLEDHLEFFKDAATAKGYVYVDWDSAFKNAIRNDWAKIRSNGSSREPPHKSQSIELPRKIVCQKCKDKGTYINEEGNFVECNCNYWQIRARPGT